MRRHLASILLLVLCAPPARADKEPFKTIHVADLEKAMKSEKPPVVCDANSKSTREKAGVIPGARLLSSSSKYDVAKELPADKETPLVFYCGNEMCMASHEAAKKAMKAGYSDVSVMSDGIYGWKKAGKPVAKPAEAPRSMLPKEVDGLSKKGGAVIVDVREGEERHEVVPGARWMPMSKAKDDKAWTDFVAGLPKDKTVVFHCMMGGRAKRAAEKLASQGFKTAYFQGPDQWKEEGLLLEKGPAN